MSTANAVNFLEKAWNDETLKGQLGERNSVESIIELATNEGFEFTSEEFYEAQMEVVDKYDIPLREDALESAAGGASLFSNTGQNSHDCHHEEVVDG